MAAAVICSLTRWQPAVNNDDCQAKDNGQKSRRRSSKEVHSRGRDCNVDTGRGLGLFRGERKQKQEEGKEEEEKYYLCFGEWLKLALRPFWVLRSTDFFPKSSDSFKEDTLIQPTSTGKRPQYKISYDKIAQSWLLSFPARQSASKKLKISWTIAQLSLDIIINVILLHRQRKWTGNEVKERQK